MVPSQTSSTCSKDPDLPCSAGFAQSQGRVQGKGLRSSGTSGSREGSGAGQQTRTVFITQPHQPSRSPHGRSRPSVKLPENIFQALDTRAEDGARSCALATNYQRQIQEPFTSIPAIMKRWFWSRPKHLKSWNIPLFTERRVKLAKTHGNSHPI